MKRFTLSIAMALIVVSPTALAKTVDAVASFSVLKDTMDKEVIYTNSTSAADDRDGPAVAAHSALTPASVHPPNVELAIRRLLSPSPAGKRLTEAVGPGADRGRARRFSPAFGASDSQKDTLGGNAVYSPLRDRAAAVYSPFTHQNG